MDARAMADLVARPYVIGAHVTTRRAGAHRTEPDPALLDTGRPTVEPPVTPPSGVHFGPNGATVAFAPDGMNVRPNGSTGPMPIPLPGLEDEPTPIGDSAEEAPDATLVGWWRQASQQDFELAGAKADEYGSIDLEIMGEAMLRTLPRDVFDAMDIPTRQHVGQQMAIGFYLLGKVGRMLSACQRGQAPSLDTWRDAGIYAMMGRRVNQTGRWG